MLQLRHLRRLVLTVGLALAPSTVNAAHPQTVFSSSELTMQRVRRTASSHAAMANALKVALDAQVGKTLASNPDPRLLGNALAGLAIAAQLLDQAPYRTLAKNNLLASLAWSDWGFGEGDDLNRAHLITGAALAYDVLFDELSAEERTRVATRLGTEAQRMSSAAAKSTWWVTDLSQNHNWINFASIGVAGYALEGEDSRAATWIAQARANSAKVKAASDFVTDGSWHEGVGYQQYGWSMSMPYWISAARRGVDVTDHAMLKAYGRYRLAIQLPTRGRQYLMTHGDWAGYAGHGQGQVLRYVASRFRDSYAQEAGRRWEAGGSRSTTPEDTFYLAFEYLAYDPTVPAANLAKTPLDYYGDDQQVAVLRSGWDGASTMIALKSGVLGGRGNYERIKDNAYPGGILNIGHDHMDDLGLWMFGDGEWLLPECVGYNIGRTSGPNAWQTVFHNALLFDGIGQLGDERFGVHNAVANSWFFQREADLPMFASTAHYSFARGDGTRLYGASAQITKLTRTIGLSREGGHVVLRDDVALAGAHTVEQVFHFLDAATQSGAWIRGNSKNDRVLGLNVVAPAAFTASIGTQTADKLSKQFEPDGSVALVKLRPNAPATKATFLELLWPTRGANWAGRPDVRALETAAPEKGLRIALASGSERWIHGGSAAVTAGDLTLRGELGVVRHGADGNPTRVVLIGVGSLTDRAGARTLLAVSQYGAIEIDFVGTVATLSGTDPAGGRFWGPTVTQVMKDGVALAWHRVGAEVVLGAGSGPEAVPDPVAPDPWTVEGAIIVPPPAAERGFPWLNQPPREWVKWPRANDPVVGETALPVASPTKATAPTGCGCGMAESLGAAPLVFALLFARRRVRRARSS